MNYSVSFNKLNYVELLLIMKLKVETNSIISKVRGHRASREEKRKIQEVMEDVQFQPIN